MPLPHGTCIAAYVFSVCSTRRYTHYTYNTHITHKLVQNCTFYNRSHVILCCLCLSIPAFFSVFLYSVSGSYKFKNFNGIKTATTSRIEPQHNEWTETELNWATVWPVKCIMQLVHKIQYYYFAGFLSPLSASQFFFLFTARCVCLSLSLFGQIVNHVANSNSRVITESAWKESDTWTIDRFVLFLLN